ncbi:MAG: amidohydrolase family protein [Pseudomonadota bacterium]
MSTFLFRNATLVDGTVDEAREGFDLLVEDDRIKEISDTAIKPPADTREIDLNGVTLMPGLTDAHVHVKATMLDLARQLTVPAFYLFAGAAQIMQGMLMRGFTTVRDAAGADRGMADAVDHALVVGPKLRVCGLALSQTGGHSDMRPVTEFATALSSAAQLTTAQLGRIADGVGECRRAARDELRKGAHQVKIMASGGVASPTDPVHNTQYSRDEITAIVEEADAHHTYVMAHAYTAQAVRRAVECGVRSIEHGNLIDAETAAFMAQRDAFHVPTNITYFALNKHGREFGLPNVSIQKLGEIVDAGLRAVELTRDAGVKIGHGTDLLGPCHKYQCDEFSLKAEVLGNFGAIKSATITNAQLFEQEDEIGKLAEGFKADLIVVRGNPLDDIGLLEQEGAHIPLVMRDGKIFKDEPLVA